MKVAKELTLLKKPGIYRIISLIDGRMYIGGTKNIQLRIQKHRHCLKKGIHRSGVLQDHYNTHGSDSIQFELVELCNEDQLLIREQFYLDIYQPFEPSGFNQCKLAGTVKGYKHSDAERAKMSKGRTGIKMSAEFRENRRKVWQNRKHLPDSIDKMKASQANKKYSDEAKRNMSLAHIGGGPIEIINTETGIFYDSIVDAAKSITHLNKDTLRYRVMGRVQNNTSFVAIR